MIARTLGYHHETCSDRFLGRLAGIRLGAPDFGGFGALLPADDAFAGVRRSPHGKQNSRRARRTGSRWNHGSLWPSRRCALHVRLGPDYRHDDAPREQTRSATNGPTALQQNNAGVGNFYRAPSGTARRTMNMSMSCDTFCEIARTATLPNNTFWLPRKTCL